METKVYIPINPCLLAFTIELVAEELLKFCQHYPGLPLISVGSGFGYLERETIKLFPFQPEFILIDPAPDSYQSPLPLGMDQNQGQVRKQFGLKPHYALLRDLFIDQPRLFVGNCSLLLLNWCDYGKNPYDLGAVFLLRPRAIFLITHKGKSANSKQFHRYFQKEKEGGKRYFCQKRFILKPFQKDDSAGKYCRENHLEYAIEWLVDSTFIQCVNKTTEVKEFACHSTEHKENPAMKLLIDLMQFTLSLTNIGDK